LDVVFEIAKFGVYIYMKMFACYICYDRGTFFA